MVIAAAATAALWLLVLFQSPSLQNAATFVTCADCRCSENYCAIDHPLPNSSRPARRGAIVPAVPAPTYAYNDDGNGGGVMCYECVWSKEANRGNCQTEELGSKTISRKCEIGGCVTQYVYHDYNLVTISRGCAQQHTKKDVCESKQGNNRCPCLQILGTSVCNAVTQTRRGPPALPTAVTEPATNNGGDGTTTPFWTMVVFFASAAASAAAAVNV